MRNLHYTANMAQTVSVCDNISLSEMDEFIVARLLPLLEVSKEAYRQKRLTPSERQVIASFLRFCRHVKTSGKGWPRCEQHSGSWVYMNLNSGSGIVCVGWEGYGDYHVSHWLE